MGTPGVPWDVPKEVIVASIIKNEGKISHVCRQLKCSHTTVDRYLSRHPDVKEILDEARRTFDEDLLDLAEDYLKTAMKQTEDLSNGLKASFFALNNKGKDRGYAPPKARDDKSPEDAQMMAYYVATSEALRKVQEEYRQKQEQEAISSECHKEET